MRKERDKSRELNEVAGGADLAAIDVDDVAHRLECIERDADRQHDLEMPHRYRYARIRQQGVQAVREEIEVLEEAEHAQVEHHAQRENRSPADEGPQRDRARDRMRSRRLSRE